LRSPAVVTVPSTRPVGASSRGTLASLASFASWGAASAVVAAALLAGCATPPPAPSAPVVRGPADCAPPELVARLQAQRARLFLAMERGDRAVLDELLTDRFVFVHASGSSESRQAFIDHVVRNAQGAAAHAGHAIEFLEDDVRVHEGLVTWVSRSATHPKNEPTLYFRATDVLEAQGAHWRWVSIRSTQATGNGAAPLPGVPQGCAVKPAPEYAHG
jgi:hypothetical protein